MNLENSPPSNAYLNRKALNEPEVYFPLKLFVCEKCFLVQIDEYKKAGEIFDKDYAYFSSFSTTWLLHSKQYTQQMIDRFQFNGQSLIMEIASNDGYLLQYFKEKNIPVLGIEPTESTAAVAIEKGIQTLVDFFGITLAKTLANENKTADLLLGNNVLAHVPDINDFVGGLKIVLKKSGIITMEFPHLLQLVSNNQFDTIYHEHFSYLSFTTVKSIFAYHGLEMFDVQEIPTHGGSLRIFAKHNENLDIPISDSVKALLKKEIDAGMLQLSFYQGFQKKIDRIKLDVLSFLIESKKSGKTVAAYGAAAKGNTLLNYCGIKNDLISFVVDASPYKQDKFLPGSHIPILQEHHLRQNKPHFIIILPWNIKDEIRIQLDYIRLWGGQFVTFVPEFSITQS